jgi:hypothetical protein
VNDVAVIRVAMRAFQAKFAREPSEVWVPHRMHERIARDTVAIFRFWLDMRRSTLFGMRFRCHDGPLTLIARGRGEVYRWRIGYGFDAARIDDERAGIFRVL